ncbi:hypothetical protein ACOSQ3_007446 [Xanthoceras sorbifolium]
MLGVTCKVDSVTENQMRGRFARLCVDVDILKPFVGKLRVEDKSVQVGYENLDLICFNCDRYGNSKKLCREGLVENYERLDERGELYDQPATKEDACGFWIMVSYDRNGRNGAVGRFYNIGNNSHSYAQRGSNSMEKNGRVGGINRDCSRSGRSNGIGLKIGNGTGASSSGGKTGGSRFEVLEEDTLVNADVEGEN